MKVFLAIHYKQFLSYSSEVFQWKTTWWLSLIRKYRVKMLCKCTWGSFPSITILYWILQLKIPSEKIIRHIYIYFIFFLIYSNLVDRYRDDAKLREIIIQYAAEITQFMASCDSQSRFCNLVPLVMQCFDLDFLFHNIMRILGQ